jgi:hypothetical protein
MIELLVTFIIISSSFLLFGYWFRYTCLLILSARTTRDYAASVAMVNQLRFIDVQSQLRSRAGANLERLKESLDRDYSVLTYLLNHAAIGSRGDAAMETRMLVIDYRIMQACYRVSSKLSPAVACRALNEMSQVVAYFANPMGERSALSAAA